MLALVMMLTSSGMQTLASDQQSTTTVETTETALEAEAPAAEVTEAPAAAAEAEETAAATEKAQAAAATEEENQKEEATAATEKAETAVTEKTEAPATETQAAEMTEAPVAEKEENAAVAETPADTEATEQTAAETTEATEDTAELIKGIVISDTTKTDNETVTEAAESDAGKAAAEVQDIDLKKEKYLTSVSLKIRKDGIVSYYKISKKKIDNANAVEKVINNKIYYELGSLPEEEELKDAVIEATFTFEDVTVSGESALLHYQIPNGFLDKLQKDSGDTSDGAYVNGTYEVKKNGRIEITPDENYLAANKKQNGTTVLTIDQVTCTGTYSEDLMLNLMEMISSEDVKPETEESETETATEAAEETETEAASEVIGETETEAVTDANVPTLTAMAMNTISPLEVSSVKLLAADSIDLAKYLTDSSTMQITVYVDGKKCTYTPEQLTEKNLVVPKGAPVKVELYFDTISKVAKGQKLVYQLPDNLMDYSGANDQGVVWSDIVWEENSSGAEVEAADWIINQDGKIIVTIRDDFFEANKHDDNTVDLFGFNKIFRQLFQEPWRDFHRRR
jgi:hypothetical protein